MYRVEAPDECGHQGDAENKVRAIELIDSDILGPIRRELDECGEEYSILLTPDHPTPIEMRTHVRTAVPFALYRSGKKDAAAGAPAYTEKLAGSTGLFVDKGCRLMEMLIRK